MKVPTALNAEMAIIFPGSRILAWKSILCAADLMPNSEIANSALSEFLVAQTAFNEKKPR